MATQKKIDTVNALIEKVSRAKTIVFADYRGLKHKQLEELRKVLKKTQGEFVVAKNRLMRRALGEEADKLKDTLNSTSAVLFAYDDEVAPLKDLLKFFKTSGAGRTKAGLLGKQFLSDKEITRFASLPSRNILLSKLVGQLNSPIQNLHYALSWNLNRLVWAINAIQKSKVPAKQDLAPRDKDQN